MCVQESSAQKKFHSQLRQHKYTSQSVENISPPSSLVSEVPRRVSGSRSREHGSTVPAVACRLFTSKNEVVPHPPRPWDPPVS